MQRCMQTLWSISYAQLPMWMLKDGSLSWSLTLHRSRENMGAYYSLSKAQLLSSLSNWARISLSKSSGMDRQVLPVSRRAVEIRKNGALATLMPEVLIWYENPFIRGQVLSSPSQRSWSGQPKEMQDRSWCWKLRLTPKAYSLMILLLMSVWTKVGSLFLASWGKERPTRPYAASKLWGAVNATSRDSLNLCGPIWIGRLALYVCSAPSRQAIVIFFPLLLQLGHEYFWDGLPAVFSPLMKRSLEPVSMLRLQLSPAMFMLRVKQQPMSLSPQLSEAAWWERWEGGRWKARISCRTRCCWADSSCLWADEWGRGWLRWKRTLQAWPERARTSSRRQDCHRHDFPIQITQQFNKKESFYRTGAVILIDTAIIAVQADRAQFRLQTAKNNKLGIDMQGIH